MEGGAKSKTEREINATDWRPLDGMVKLQLVSRAALDRRPSPATLTTCQT